LAFKRIAVPDTAWAVGPITHRFDVLCKRWLAICRVGVTNFRVLATASLTTITWHWQLCIACPDFASLAHGFEVIDVRLEGSVLVPWRDRAALQFWPLWCLQLWQIGVAKAANLECRSSRKAQRAKKVRQLHCDEV